MDAEQHFGAARGNERHVARELDEIAHALLGHQEDGLTPQILVSAPYRFRAVAEQRTEILSFPAVLVLLPALAKVAETQPRNRGIEVRFGIFRLERDRCGKACQR